MKKFNSLFYSGLFIILTPLLIIIVVTLSSYEVKPPLIEKPEKYYDTIKVKKIQWIEKIKSDTNQIKIEQ